MGDISLVYIAGMGRSGTTLVEGLLAARPGFFAVGEMVYLWERGVRGNELCSCGRRFHDCPFWTAVIADAFNDSSEKLAAELEGAHRRFMGRGRSRDGYPLNAMIDAQRRVYASVVKLSGATVVVDSSKFPAYGRALSTQPELDVRPVHVVRDSRAVAHSWQRRKRRPEADEADAFMPVYSARTIAKDWVRMNRESAALVRAAERGVQVRYEDLEESRAVVDRALAELGLSEPLSESVPAPHGHRHSVSGNPSRLQDTPATVRIDDDWVSAMPRDARVVVTSMTAPWLLRYGYRLRGARPR